MSRKQLLRTQLLKIQELILKKILKMKPLKKILRYTRKMKDMRKTTIMNEIAGLLSSKGVIAIITLSSSLEEINIRNNYIFSIILFSNNYSSIPYPLFVITMTTVQQD